MRNRKLAFNIGVVTEGHGEVTALPMLYAQLERECRGKLMHPIHVAVDPQSPIPILSSRLIPRIRQSFGRGAAHVIVLLDSEDAAIDPAGKARTIYESVAGRGLENFSVVLKHTKFENWLIADRLAFQSQPRLFPDASRIAYAQGRADEVDAQRLIDIALGRRQSYVKTLHPDRILKAADVETMKSNSRSFKFFVETLGSSR